MILRLGADFLVAVLFSLWAGGPGWPGFVIGLAVGFALQGSLANFASGVMIIFFRPFKAGDFVEVAGTSGVVLEVQVFATTLRTGDNKKIIIPNGSITGGNIIVAQAYVTDITPREKRTESLGYIFAVFGIGFIVGPALGGLLAAAFGPRIPYVIAAIVAAGVV